MSKAFEGFFYNHLLHSGQTRDHCFDLVTDLYRLAGFDKLVTTCICYYFREYKYTVIQYLCSCVFLFRSKSI